MFKNPIVLCSSFCEHSRALVEKMKTTKEHFKDVVFIKIDMDVTTRKRPQAFYDLQNVFEWNIKTVPTVITNEGKSLLSGRDAFEWVDETVQTASEYRPSNMAVNEEFSNLGDSSAILSESEMQKLSSTKYSNKKDVANIYDTLLKSRQETNTTERPQRSLSPPLRI